MFRAGQVQVVPELCKTKMNNWKKFLPQAFEARLKAFKNRRQREVYARSKAK